MTGPIDRAGSGVGCDVGCDVGCGGGTHRRRGAAGDRVMPDVRSRSLSPGSARAVGARERSDDSKNAFWLFGFLANNSNFVFGNGFTACLPIRSIPNYAKTRTAVSVFFPEHAVWTARERMISKTREISSFFREWVSGGAHAWGSSITAVAKRDCTRCGRERPSAGTPIARRERCREGRSRRGTARANLDL